jgi:hypothetical protein
LRRHAQQKPQHDPLARIRALANSIEEEHGATPEQFAEAKRLGYRGESPYSMDFYEWLNAALGD